MSSGYIPAKDEPGPDETIEAFREAVFENPRLREMPSEEVARQLILGGHLQEEPSPELVADMLFLWRLRRKASRPTSSPRRVTPREYETDKRLELEICMGEVRNNKRDSKTRTRRFPANQIPALRFRALLTDGEREVRFERVTKS